MKATGLNKHAGSPSSIVNREHNDTAGAKKTLDGTGRLKQVLGDTTTKVPVEEQSTLRVVNDSGSTAYIWLGQDGDEPATVDATNGFALPNGHVEHLYAGSADDPKKGLVVKSSSASVQVVVLEE